MWRDFYSEVSQPVPDLEKLRAVINLSSSASSTDQLANTHPTDGRTTYMNAARGGTDLHLSCLRIVTDKHMEKCGPYFSNQRLDPLKRRDNYGWSLFMHAAHGGHIKTLEYVLGLHHELKVGVNKTAIDSQNVTGDAAVNFVVNNVFGGSFQAFADHIPSKSLRSPCCAGNRAESGDWSASYAASTSNGTATREPDALLASSHPNQLQGEGGINPPDVPDNEGQSGEKKSSADSEEEDRKPPAAAEGDAANAAGGNNQQLSQGSQASNEISDDDAAYSYTTDTEGAADKLVAAGSKRNQVTAATPHAPSGGAGADDNDGHMKKRPFSAKPTHHKRRPYKLPMHRSVSHPSSRQDLEAEVEKQKGLAKAFEEQAKVAATQLSALQEEKDRQDRKIAALHEALASKNSKLTNIKGSLGCISHMLEGVLKECRAESVPNPSNLECIKGSLGCISHVLDDKE